jgi:haloalkane dehalogenase
MLPESNGEPTMRMPAMPSTSSPNTNSGRDVSSQIAAILPSKSANPPRPPWLDVTRFPFESRYMTLEGNRIHYIDEGAGPVLLFLHTMPVWSFQYRTIIKGLRDRFRCIALDYPGFGLPAAAPGFRNTLLGHSRLVEGFIRDLALSEVTLVVYAVGGCAGR